MKRAMEERNDTKTGLEYRAEYREYELAYLIQKPDAPKMSFREFVEASQRWDREYDAAWERAEAEAEAAGICIFTARSFEVVRELERIMLVRG